MHFGNEKSSVLFCFGTIIKSFYIAVFIHFLVLNFCSERKYFCCAFHSGSELEKLHLVCLIVSSGCMGSGIISDLPSGEPSLDF